VSINQSSRQSTDGPRQAGGTGAGVNATQQDMKRSFISVMVGVGAPYSRFFGKMVAGYPCPILHERFPSLHRYGPCLKKALIQRHPCLYRPDECRHFTCASKAHQDGYACTCPAGSVTYAPMTRIINREDTVNEHPCTLFSGDSELARSISRLLPPMCHHRCCAVEAHRNGYQCQPNTSS
jgi:hypothetical protein